MADSGAQTRVVFGAWLDAERECVRCGDVYCERENLGTHQCAIHPLGRATYGSERVYECCGGDADAPGCCPADHVDDWSKQVAHSTIVPHASFAARSTLVLPGERFAMLGDTASDAHAYVRTHSWREHRGPGGGYEVQRVDLQRYERARNVKCRALAGSCVY